jgi:hypothetical protein
MRRGARRFDAFCQAAPGCSPKFGLVGLPGRRAPTRSALLKVTERSRVHRESVQFLARLVPVERQPARRVRAQKHDLHVVGEVVALLGSAYRPIPVVLTSKPLLAPLLRTSQVARLSPRLYFTVPAAHIPRFRRP